MSNANIDDLLLLFWFRVGASMLRFAAVDLASSSNEIVKFLIVALVSI